MGEWPMATRPTRKDSSLDFSTTPELSGTSSDPAFRINGCVFHPEGSVSVWSRGQERWVALEIYRWYWLYSVPWSLLILDWSSSPLISEDLLGLQP